MPKKAKIKHITIISNSVEIFVAFCSKYLRSWNKTHSCYQSALSAYKNRKIKQSAVIEIQFTLMPPLVLVQSTVNINVTFSCSCLWSWRKGQLLQIRKNENMKKKETAVNSNTISVVVISGAQFKCTIVSNDKK